VFKDAAEMSAQLNIVWLPRSYRRVVSVPGRRYLDLWTAAKAIYKTEPVVGDGGEVVVYAPWLTRVSATHGDTLARIGYHVRDYFTAQADRFLDVPGGIRAHSTHVRGQGTYDASTGVEQPRIRVSLATGISDAETTALGLGYADPATIDLDAEERDPAVLVVRDAGERLYRLDRQVQLDGRDDSS
jgi:nickel-dependent lactate racemase